MLRLASRRLLAVRGLATIAKSPFAPVPAGPYPRLPDMVMEHWNTFDPNKIAVLDGVTEEARTFEAMGRNVNALATSLSSMGVGHGDVVLIMSPNHCDFATVVLAATKVLHTNSWR